MALDIATLERMVGQIPHPLLASQRWFRSKGRPIFSLALEEAAPLDAASGSRDAALLVVRVSFSDAGPDELYLLPMVSEPDGPGPSPAEEWGIVAIRDAETGMVLREPRDGDGVWTSLLAGVAVELTLPALHGSFAFHSLRPIPQALDERRLGGEQSNTSVALGDQLLLKLYRRLEPGENPDLELPRFLSQAGFDRVPQVAGFVRYVPARGEPTAVAMVQTFLPDAVDAWRWLLDELTLEVAPMAALRAIARVGEITAQMHAALASRSDDPDFPVRPASPEDLQAWRASAEEQLDRAIAAAAQLAAGAPSIRRAFDGIHAIQDAQLSRIHGDYHLGQLLRSGGDFWVIDFEGEPARPLADRRQPQSPLKDVAGMLRSLDYAARTVERNETASGFDAEGWLPEARAAFLGAYRSGGRPADDGLLRAFEIEKACYEVYYEANNRPEWVWLPLQALDRLALGGGSRG